MRMRPVTKPRPRTQTQLLTSRPAPSLQNRRYPSMARIHSMTIEAPITKVSGSSVGPRVLWDWTLRRYAWSRWMSC